MLPRPSCAWTWTSCSGRAHGGCWRWRWRPRSTPTSPATPSRSTTGQRQQFQSMILPRWVRRSPKVAAVLPLLYLHGLSSSDFVPALEELVGSAEGLSASVITRLCTQWQAEREAFAQRDLSEVDYVYCFADGVHFSIRLGDQGRLCCLVIVGVRADGRKELVAVADGTRESTDDWAELLRDLRRRGMRAPVVMVGDGALGLWRALGEVFPQTREQKCWQHVTRNVLGALPKSVHAGARRALNEIILAKDRGLAMVFKLLQAAEGHWRAVNGPHLVALVRAGARFEAGKLIERPDQTPDKEAGEGVDKV